MSCNTIAQWRQVSLSGQFEYSKSNPLATPDGLSPQSKSLKYIYSVGIFCITSTKTIYAPFLEIPTFILWYTGDNNLTVAERTNQLNMTHHQHTQISKLSKCHFLSYHKYKIFRDWLLVTSDGLWSPPKTVKFYLLIMDYLATCHVPETSLLPFSAFYLQWPLMTFHLDHKQLNDLAC